MRRSSLSRTLLISQLLLLLQLCRPSFQFSATLEKKKSSLSPPSALAIVDDDDNTPKQQPPKLSGSWSTAKLALRNPNCCVVSISGLHHHLSILQTYFCGEDAPSDIDLRMRVRCYTTNNNINNSSSSGATTETIVYQDCENIYNTIMNPSIKSWRNNTKGTTTTTTNIDTTSTTTTTTNNHDPIIDENNHHPNPCILALQELALGVCSLAEHGPLKLSSSVVTDVHIRIVCASNYKAIDPPFHTDKCPLRGYVTLVGPGTEYMDRTCRPWEYVALRTLGVEGLMMDRSSGGSSSSSGSSSLKMAKELEFIVMKGDHYDAGLLRSSSSSSILSHTNKLLWSRSEACVHRSPPGNDTNNNNKAKNNKRVILSLDLADGGDDQEWEERGRKRNWRVGMTQRKSHLVS